MPSNLENLDDFAGSKSVASEGLYFYNGWSCKDVSLYAFTTRLSSLINHIFHVVFAVAKKKMLWIYAWRIVAFVKNMIAFWNFPLVKLIRNSVGCSEFSIPIKNAIRQGCFAFKSCTFPNPAPSKLFVGSAWAEFVNLHPKSLTCGKFAFGSHFQKFRVFNPLLPTLI